MKEIPGGPELDTESEVDLSEQRLERIAAAAFENERDVQAMRAKFQDKIDFKDAIVQDDGTNDRGTWKRLGAFIVHEQRFSKPFAEVLRGNGVNVFEDETVLELHIPPQELTLEKIVHSMRRLREYLQANRNDQYAPKFLYGVTYLLKKIKAFVRRYGFRTVDLPQAIKEDTGAARLLATYENSENPVHKALAEKFAVEDIQLCYVSVEDFLGDIDKVTPADDIAAIIRQQRALCRKLI